MEKARLCAKVCPQNLGKMLSLRLHLWNESYIRALLQKGFLLYNVPPCHWLTLSTSMRKWHLIQIQPLRRDIFKELLLIFIEKRINGLQLKGPVCELVTWVWPVNLHVISSRYLWEKGKEISSTLLHVCIYLCNVSFSIFHFYNLIIKFILLILQKWKFQNDLFTG